MYVCRMYSDRDWYKEIAKKLREGCGETPLPQRPSQDSQDRGDGVLKRYETLEAFERRLAAILPAYDVLPRVMRARDSQVAVWWWWGGGMGEVCVVCVCVVCVCVCVRVDHQSIVNNEPFQFHDDV